MFLALRLVLMACILIFIGQGTYIYVPKGATYILNVTSNITVSNTSCGYHEVDALIWMNSTEENFSPSRLAAIPLQELKPQSTVGTITQDTQQDFRLGNISFLSTVNKSKNSHDEFKLHLKLEIVIPESATNYPLFDEIELVVRCLKRNDVSSLGTRHEAGHYGLVYYNQTKKISPTPVNNHERLTKSPLSTGQGSALNSTVFTQLASKSFSATPSSPESGPSEEKKTLPGQDRALNSIASTQASQNLGLPATTSSPDSGPSEEKKNRSDTQRKTDESLALDFFLAALIISLVMLLTIIVLSMIF